MELVMKAGAKAKEKFLNFKMPHLLFMMLGLIVLMSALTYVLPTGKYVEVDGIQHYVSVERTPVNVMGALLLIVDGIVNSSKIIAILLVTGGCMAVVLGTKAIDRLVDYALYRLQDKGSTVLIPCVFFLISIIGGFNIEASVPLFPLGILVAKKLKLDHMAAAGITVLASLVGWSTSPASCYVAQLMIGVPMYSGFLVRALNLIICSVVGSLFVLRYAKRIEKDPAKSFMGDANWLQEFAGQTEEIKEAKLDPRDILIITLFFAQYAIYFYLMLGLGFGIGALPTVMLPVAIACGLLNHDSCDLIGKRFEDGTKDMSFLCVLIGFAGVISLIMKNGQIMATITYYLSMPLKDLSSGYATIGIASVIAAINFVIPSASAKAAALIPIIKPMAEMLNISPQLAVQAFQVGDGFMNILSPFNAVTLAGIALAKVSYGKWAKWVIPLMVVYYGIESVFLFMLGSIGWR